LDPIVDAVRIMAGNKVGSIICILRQNRPESIIENAVRVNGQISSELLQTIFHKDTALHDGAVLIENDRIIAASCYLPLSNSRALKRTHGARHRAAMGFSEETDSLVIVTSEETGRISVLLNGELKGPLKPMELKEIMRLVLFESKNRLSELEESQSGETRTTVAAASKKK
ncbi:MAG: DNA integrity scanning protein DisA nucleotide-binding domain protein, partial [Leptospiraceae bacterium]|nr:DNA integrity scanning protein DisA nucleotide-binding domain protein [Leptospiraceae bacterium]